MMTRMIGDCSLRTVDNFAELAYYVRKQRETQHLFVRVEITNNWVKESEVTIQHTTKHLHVLILWY